MRGIYLWSLVVFGVLRVCSAQNATETVHDEFDDFFRNEYPNKAIPALSVRGELPEATALPPAGLASSIGPNETHYYSWNISHIHPNISLSLSECIRSPLSEDPLTLISGTFKDTTSDGGFLGVYNLTEFNNTLAVSSPRTSNAQAQWSYQLGYDYSASYSNDAEGLYWVDSDFANSLFVTAIYENFTRLLVDSPYMNFVNQSNLNETTKQFKLFLHDVNGTTPQTTQLNSSSTPSGSYDGLGVYDVLGKSYCAMQDSALLNQNNADFSTTNRGNNKTDQFYRGQFLFTGLNNSNAYQMQLAIPPVTGSVGGMLFAPVPFHTKESRSCQLIYNMTTCPNTAFSVPGNASEFNVRDLTKLYDEYVEQYYSNFTQALAMVNCDAIREDRFSVFSTCEDCKEAYQNWLCTVAVPRCEDWTNTAPYLKERLPGESRNQMINEVLQPGKYKEVLPCYWLCDNLATYCPMSLNFGCPKGNLLNESYGWQSDNGDVTCSYPGAVYKPDAAMLRKPSWVLIMLTTAFLCVVMA